MGLRRNSPPRASADDWRTILVAGYNAGGRGYYALDITNPSVAGVKALWEFRYTNGSQDSNLNHNMTTAIDGKGQAQGRPVGVAIDKAGALLVADDLGETVWRVTPATRTASAASTASRSASLIWPQRAISSSVLWQPRQ